MLINVKVKTLDGQNHEFSVDNEITVREFKDKVADKTSISADQQRVIYCGRVMVDDKQLKEYDVDGKVVHVAERPPPSQRLPNSESTSTNGNPVGERRPRGIPVGGGLRNSPLFRSLDGMVVGTMAFPVNANANGQAPVNPLAASSSFCMNRITVARHMLDCANNIAAFLEDPSRGLNNQPLDILTRGRWTMESTVVEVGITSDIPQSQQIVQMVQGAVQAALRRSGNTNVTLVQLPTVYSSSEGNNATPAVTAEADASAADATATDDENATAASVVLEDVIDDDEDDDTPTNEQLNDDNTSNAIAATVDEDADNARESSPAAEEGNNDQLRRRTGTRVLARVIDQMRNVQNRLNPFVEQYYDMLLNEPSFEEEETTRHAQRLFDRVSEAFHYLSHAQHAISDLMLDVSQPAPRFLTCRPILVEQSGYVSSNNLITPAMIPAVFRQPSRNSTAATANTNSAPTATITAPLANTSDSTNTTGVSGSTNSSTASSTNEESNNSTVDDPIDEPVTWPPTINFGIPPAANDTNASNTTNNNAAGRGNFQRQVARLLQDVVSAAPFDTEFHVHINSPNVMSFDVPIGGPTLAAAAVAGGQQRSVTTNNSENNAAPTTDNSTSSPGATTPPSNNNATTTPASASTPSSNANPARVTTATLPTTSTQTRSTARPQVHIGNIPVLSMPSGWNGRALPSSNVSSFDRFMPCNSHHIRGLESYTRPNDNNANGNSNQGPRNHGTRANIFRRLPLRYRLPRPTRRVVGSTMTDPSLSAHGRASSSGPGQGPVFNFTNSQSSATPPAQEAQLTAFRNLLERTRLNFELPPSSATSSAAAAAGSTAETRRLNMHNKLMNLIKNHIFEGKPINDETMPPAINRAVQWFGQALIYLPQYEKPEYNSMDSLFNILRKTLPLFIKLINRTPPNLTEFEQKLKEICEQFRKRMYSVLYVCTGRTNAELYWGQLMSLLCLSIQSPCLDDEVVDFLTLYLDSNIPSGADEADAQQFIVYRNVSNSSCDRAGTTPMDTDVEMTEVAGTSQPDVEDEPLPAVVSGSAPWHRNFPNDWLPIITRDIQRQTENPPNQPPYSDAYISGMSSKRRKLVQHSKPPTEISALIADSVSRAIHSAGVGTSTSSNQSQTPDEIARFISSDAAVQASCIEAVRVNVRERLKNDTDYDPEKFPKATKFIQK